MNINQNHQFKPSRARTSCSLVLATILSSTLLAGMAPPNTAYAALAQQAPNFEKTLPKDVNLQKTEMIQRWFRNAGSKPHNAMLFAGFIQTRKGKEDIYVCRAAYGGGVHPGWIHPESIYDGCIVGWNGKLVTVPAFEWLVNMPGTASWQEVQTIPLPKHTFYGGREAGGPDLAVCRGWYTIGKTNDGVYRLLGKVTLRRSTNPVICTAGFGGVEMTLNNPDVLVLQR